MITRREAAGMFGGLLLCAASATANDSRERVCLKRIKRAAEKWGGIVAKTYKPTVPPVGSIYREFWDIAEEGLR